MGPSAFEVLLRVYAKEGPIDLNLSSVLEQVQDEVQIPSTGHGGPGHKMRKISIISDPDEYSDEDGGPNPHNRRDSRQGLFAVVCLKALARSSYPKGLMSFKRLIG